MRTLLVPVCFMLAMPFCCGLAAAAPDTASIAHESIPVATAKCVVDDGDSKGGGGNDPDEPSKKGPKLPDQPHEHDKIEQPGTKAPSVNSKPTPASPSPSSSGPDPAAMCETRMSDSCEAVCEDHDLAWDSNAGSHDGTCFKLRSNHSPAGGPIVKCGCMCI
jgi:hypothetical protein